MKNETNEKIARDAAEKIHWHHVKKPDAYSQEEAARTSKIILAAEREHRKLVDAVLDNRMLQLRKCETELAAERETIEMLHRQRQAAERQRDSVIRQADAERERRKPLAEANLRLVEALELARKWLPNSRCPTPNEERAYEIIDAALALATRHDEQAVSPSDGGQAKEQP